MRVGKGPYKGIIRGVAFAGEQREYVIDADLGQIKASVPTTEPLFELGTTVDFDLPQTGALRLPEHP